MRSLLLIFLFTLTITSILAADPHNHHREDEPNDALCSTFSGRNSTCSSCILQGCSYCDITGTGYAGLCLSAKTAHHTCNKSTTLISSFSSLTLCQRTEHDLYESLSAFIPILSTFIAFIAFILLGWYVKPAYAPVPPTEEIIHVGENPNAPLLGDSRWYRIQQRWQTTRVSHFTRSSGWCVKLFITALFVTVLVLSIVTVAVQMWSLQIDGEDKENDDEWDTSTSAVFYGSYGLFTITRNPSNHDDLIFRYTSYHCNNLIGDNFIRCSLHRIITSSTGICATISLAFLGIVALQITIALFCCRSLSNYSVKFMTLSAITSWLAVMIYAGGAYLLQSRIYDDANTIKSMTAAPTPYRLYLGLSWDCCLAAAIINTFMLIPLSRIHIKAIQSPKSNPCCCRRKRSSSQQNDQQHDGVVQGPMGVAVAIAQPVSGNPFIQSQQSQSQPPFVYGSYQQGSIQQPPPQTRSQCAIPTPHTPSQRPSQPNVGQPLLGFTNEI